MRLLLLKSNSIITAGVPEFPFYYSYMLMFGGTIEESSYVANYLAIGEI